MICRICWKYTESERKATKSLGEFTLFGLFERGDTPGRLDIVVSAPWLTPDRDAIVKVAHFLPKPKPGDSALTGSIVPLPPDTEFAQAVIRLLGGSGGYTLENGVRALGAGGDLLADVEIMRSSSCRRAV